MRKSHAFGTCSTKVSRAVHIDSHESILSSTAPLGHNQVHHAATHRNAVAQAAEALCAKGASTELVDSDGNNALHLAAASGNVTVLDVFAS